MRRRVVLGALVGFLLPVPFMLLLGGTWAPGHFSAPGLDDGRVSPMLSAEEREMRMTYRRGCSQASDCEPSLACLGDARFGALYCTDSECVSDEQCPDGAVCRVLSSTMKGSPYVRFCVPVGARQEGERCVDLTNKRASACASGLLCGGSRLGWCGRSCRMGEPTSCPEGFFCADVPPEPICLPSCEGRGCPDGQQCIVDDDGGSTCVQVHGTECQQNPCPDGQECRLSFATENPGEVWMECIQRCGPEHPPCPEGRICARGRCQQPCEPGAPGACERGYRCEQRKPTAPFLCEPDWDK